MTCKDCDNLREITKDMNGAPIQPRYYCRLFPNVMFGSDVLSMCYCRKNKAYTLEELEELHDKYMEKGLCLGYCAECGINMFIGWLNRTEEMEELMKKINEGEKDD